MTISLFIDFDQLANMLYEDDWGGKWAVLLLFYAS